MSFFSSPAFGQIAGSVIGGIMGNKAAKYQAAADRYAVDQQMRPFNLKEPFLKDLYSGAQGALDDALTTQQQNRRCLNDISKLYQRPL